MCVSSLGYQYSSRADRDGGGQIKRVSLGDVHVVECGGSRGGGGGHIAFTAVAATASDAVSTWHVPASMGPTSSGCKVATSAVPDTFAKNGR